MRILSDGEEITEERYEVTMNKQEFLTIFNDMGVYGKIKNVQKLEINLANRHILVL